MNKNIFFNFQSTSGLDSILKSILHLIRSTRPQDCITASYILDLYVQTPQSENHLKSFMRSNNMTGEGK